MTTVAGKVLDPEGKPLKGATVYWIGNRKSQAKLPFVALPRGFKDAAGRIETIARGETDADGSFRLAAAFDEDRYAKFDGVFVHLVVQAPGFGMLGRQLEAKDLGRDLALQLPREQVIRGRLITPGGMPAEGVRVALGGFHNDEKNQGVYSGGSRDDDEVAEYWPRPIRTDVDGRFTIRGVPVGVYATVSFRHPEYAVDEVTVNTIPERTLSPGIRGFDIVPVEPDFEHALEPARPVEGRVTDKATGAPLADVPIEMIPMRRHGGQTFSTRTDADGRYRVSGHTTDGTYFIHAYPPADSGYLSLTELRTGSEVVGRTLKVDMALDRGRLISGRVVDQDTKAPVAGAAVVYQPRRKNPNNSRNYDLRNPVLADADGRFRVTALPGEGFLAVEAASDAYIRVSGDSSNRSRGMYPHGLLNVDVPKDGEVPPVEIPLRKGKPLEARVLDPDGRPLEGFLAKYAGINACLVDDWEQGKPFTEGRFRIPGADPDRTYRVFFVSIARRLGAVAELKLDPSGKPLEVRLQPTATIKGRVVEAGGGPPREAQAYPRMLLRPERKEYTREDLFDGAIACFYSNFLSNEAFYFHRDQPAKDGSFSFEGLVPGVGFQIAIGTADRSASTLVWDLKPGEVRDVGTLTLKEIPR